VARPVTISDDAILDAAREVFLSRGLAATTADVAAIAKVSEGIIFKRFGTKAELFGAAMQHGMREKGLLFFSTLRDRTGKSTVREELYAMGMEMLEAFRVVVPVVMMTWSNASSCPAGAFQDGDPMPVRSIKAFASYFESEMKLGRLRRSDPEIVARGWIGAIWHFAMMEVTVPDYLPLTAETFLRGHIDNLLRGLTPERSEKSRSPKSATARTRRR
jgi:AcrR family transcriptional regulator